VARFRLFEVVQSLLARMVRNRPLAIFIDDVHAVDTESLALLEFVGQGIADWPLLFILTHRDTGSTSSTEHARTLGRLFALSSAERWPVSGLVGEDLAEFARLVVGARCSPTLVDALVDLTSGNPLLVGESLRSLHVRNLLGERRESSEWKVLLPPGIDSMIDAKLRSRSEEARSVLAVASAIGIEVDAELLDACLPVGGRSQDAFSELADVGLLMRNGQTGRLRFSHALVRDAVYALLVPSGPIRRNLHARISTAMDRLTRLSTVELAERARHACEGVPSTDPTRATGLAREMAEKAAALNDFEAATAWYERALNVHGQDERRDARITGDLLLGLGTAQIAAYGLDRARDTLRRAAANALATSRPDLLARAALAYADRPNSAGSDDPMVLDLLEQAAAALPEDERALRIRVRSRLSAEQRYGDRSKAMRLSNAVIVEARVLGDPAVLAQALDDGTFVLWSPTDPERWTAQNAEAAEMARRAGDELIELSGNKGRVTGHLELGDIVGVHRAVRDCGRAAEKLRTPNARWWMEVLTATQDLLVGDLELAERHIVSSMQLADRVRSPDVALEMQAQFVYLRIEQGRASEIEPATRDQMRRFPEQPAWRAARGRVLIACGRIVEAAELLKSLASHGFDDVPQDRVWLGTHALAAEVAHACGDRRVAEMIERLLIPYASLGTLLSSVLYYGPVAHHLGLACATQEKWESAIAHFEAALEIESRLCAHVFAARTRVALARTLRFRDSGGDRARAVSLVSEVLAIAERQGLIEIAAEARTLEQGLWKDPSKRAARRRTVRAGQ
jgi:tetratricopeptide (TPR) repeat protein